MESQLVRCLPLFIYLGSIFEVPIGCETSLRWTVAWTSFGVNSLLYNQVSTKDSFII